jgi:hypothetical protein
LIAKRLADTQRPPTLGWAVRLFSAEMMRVAETNVDQIDERLVKFFSEMT